MSGENLDFDRWLVRIGVIFLLVFVIVAFASSVVDNILLRFGYGERFIQTIKDTMAETDEQYESSLATLFRSLDDAKTELAGLGLAERELRDAISYIDDLKNELDKIARENAAESMPAGDYFEMVRDR